LFAAVDPETDRHFHTVFIRELCVASGALGCALWDGGVILSRWIYDNPDRLTILFNFTHFFFLICRHSKKKKNVEEKQPKKKKELRDGRGGARASKNPLRAISAFE
jgi:hypothetical protein